MRAIEINLTAGDPDKVRMFFNEIQDSEIFACRITSTKYIVVCSGECSMAYVTSKLEYEFSGKYEITILR